MLHPKPRRLSLVDGGLIARLAVCALAVAAFGTCLALRIEGSSARAESPAVRAAIIPAGVRSLGSRPEDYRLTVPALPKLKCPIAGYADVEDHAACICFEQGGHPARMHLGLECWRPLPDESYEIMWELVTELEQ